MIAITYGYSMRKSNSTIMILAVSVIWDHNSFGKSVTPGVGDAKPEQSFVSATQVVILGIGS